MKRRDFAGILTTVMLLLASTVAAQSRFSSSQETGGAPGRYRVELELRPGDDLAAISNQLAATYGARIETFAEEGFSGFAIIATPARARLMSSDPRVVGITDLNPAVHTDSPHGTQSAEAAVVTKAKVDTPTVAVEQSRGIATETVPGFGNYFYDPSGNITSIDTQAFRYDPFGRLQTANLGSFGTKAYTYDRYGNIVKVVTDGDDVNAASMSVDPATNRMDLPFSGSNPANLVATYDDVGNVITHNGTFVYDALNMMKETTDTGRRLHVYSASDERVVVIQVANGVETSSEWTLRDGSNRVLRRLTKDTGGVWHWKEDYIYGGTSLLAAEVPGSERVRHFHADHLGTPRLITGNGGVRIAEKTYDPFGPKVSPATDDFEQLEFTGHERDTPALDYMHARYYQPDLRRFLSVDSVRNDRLRMPQAWNRYAYALNNPLARIDPDGRKDRMIVVNTLSAGAFDRNDRAALTAGVAGTRFEGRVSFVGPFASNAAAETYARSADASDAVAILTHAGRLDATGGMMVSQNSLAALQTGAAKGNLTDGLSGDQLAAAANDGSAPTIMIAGCQSGWAAMTVASVAGTAVLGTSNDAIAGEQGNAVVAAFTAFARTGSPTAAAAAGSEQYKTAPRECHGDPGCDTSRPATLDAYGTPPQ